MRRIVAAMVGVVLLAACTRDAERPRATPPPSTPPSAPPSPSPSAAPASPTAAAAAGSPQRSPSRAPSASPASSPQVAPPASPAAPAAPGEVRQPAPGEYVYDLTGTSTGSLGGPARPYPPGATQVVRVGPGTPVAGGTEYEAVQTSPQEPNVSITLRTRWEPGGVRLVSTVITLLALSNYPCAYNPPPQILRIPPVAETFPQQSFAGDCSGTVDVTVGGPEQVEAAGRTWRAWRIQSKSTFRMGLGPAGTIDTTMWLAPDLGQPVRTRTVIDATVLANRLTNDQTAVLRSHP